MPVRPTIRTDASLGLYNRRPLTAQPSMVDAIMDEEVQEKQLLAEEEDGMEQLEAEEGLEAAQLEPDGAKHMELEPDGIKELAAEKELVSKDSVAAPMELITHSGVNLEPRWRRHDPKPPWFLIQAQEISKWACVSFVLFFPCQVLSQWVFLTRDLFRWISSIAIRFTFQSAQSFIIGSFVIRSSIHLPSIDLLQGVSGGAMASEEEEEETSRESPSSLNEAMLEQIKKMMIEEFDRREKIKEGKRKQPKDPVTSKKKPIEDLSGYMMIPPFHGNNDPDVYLDWERKCEIIFNRHNIADINRVTLAAMEFKYYALSWWKQVETARAYSGAYEISTWGEMKRVMRQRFAPIIISDQEQRPRAKELPSKVIPSSISPKPMAAESVKEVPKDHAEKGLGAKDVSVQTPCYQLQGNKKQEIVSVSNNGKVQAKLFQTVYDDSMTGMMHLSFSKGVETGTGSSEEQMEKANQEKETQPNLDPPESKPPDQQLQDHEFNPEGPEPNNKRKSKSEQEYSQAMPTSKLSEFLNQHIHPVFLTVLMHLSWFKEVEKGTAEQERRLEAHKALTCHTKKEYEQHVLKPIAAADSLMSVLNSTQVSEAQYLIYYWDHFMIHQKLQNFVFEIPISSIMHLFFSLSVNKGSGFMEKHKELEEAASKNNTVSSHVHLIPCSPMVLCLSSLFTKGEATLNQNQEEWLTFSNPIPEKPPDSYLGYPKKQTQGKYLDSQRRMRPNLLSFGAGQLVLRTKLFQEGGDDAIMDEEVQEKQLLAEEEDGMEQLEAEEGLEAAQLEPDGAKHMELEPDGIKELAAEKELVSKDSVAAPMELITHSGVNLEPRWRRHDPKPPWFLIQAQEISKWACVSFVLFFPCQVLSQWVFLTRDLFRWISSIAIRFTFQSAQSFIIGSFVIRSVHSLNFNHDLLQGRINARPASSAGQLAGSTGSSATSAPLAHLARPLSPI
ncbi:unnamed protein product [Microthlaspi erraticum]|uniref:Retrotransposon gag domain-containing protein n=1 Tax=Microthlaspi erraticum TaxID=1685480 RepID=A0A6D2IJQ3_9BRAS|nr:unnamed protein product [Microthlaspi erraticum]